MDCTIVIALINLVINMINVGLKVYDHIARR